ncbi:Sulfotransferase 1C2A, partial [Tupaia chinensis]
LQKVIENIPNTRIILKFPIELEDISKLEELKLYCKLRLIPIHLNYGMLPILIKCKGRSLYKSIKEISTILSINVSNSEVNKIAWKMCFSEMKNNAAREVCGLNRTICALTTNRNMVFKEGVVDDWINYFTSKQKRVFDELFTEKMKHKELARHSEDYS